MKRSDFRDYLRTLKGATRWRLAMVVVLSVLASLTEGVALVLLVPILEVIGFDVGAGAVGQLGSWMKGVFDLIGVRPTLVPVLVLYAVVGVLLALLRLGQSVTSSKLHNGFAAELRENLYQAIAGSSWLFIARSRASDFTHALTAEIDRVSAGTQQLVMLGGSIIVTSVYLVFALWLSPGATVFALLGGGGLILLLKRAARGAHTAGVDLTASGKELYATAIDHLSGMKMAKSHGAEEHGVALFSHQTRRLADSYVRAVRNQANVKFWYDTGVVVVVGVVLYAALEVVGLRPAEILLLLFVFLRLTPRLSGIQQSYQRIVNMLPAFAAVRDMQARCDAAAEGNEPSSEPMDLTRRLDVEHVSFSYRESAPALVIDDVSLTVEAGRTTAIVGSSGSGKTTLADLVTGLLEPKTGQVIVDGVALTRERARAWRGRIGYVSQDTFLFNDTVRANLLWGNPGASEQDLWDALSSAAAAEFVSTLPDKLETVVGDRGVRLSGGERQRLALARALLRRPALLVLDEATSHLDSESERRIQQALERLHGTQAILVIAHRLTTIRSADVIYVLEGGRVVESGRWDDLVNASGRLSELHLA